MFGVVFKISILLTWNLREHHTLPFHPLKFWLFNVFKNFSFSFMFVCVVGGMSDKLTVSEARKKLQRIL